MLQVRCLLDDNLTHQHHHFACTSADRDVAIKLDPPMFLMQGADTALPALAWPFRTINAMLADTGDFSDRHVDQLRRRRLRRLPLLLHDVARFRVHSPHVGGGSPPLNRGPRIGPVPIQRAFPDRQRSQGIPGNFPGYLWKFQRHVSNF